MRRPTALFFPVSILASCATAPAPDAVPSGWLAAPAALPPAVQSVDVGVTDAAEPAAARSADVATAARAAHEPPPQGPPGAGAPPAPRRTSTPVRWRPGEVLLQGFLGAATYEVESQGGNTQLQDTDATFPTIGGGAQWKLGGERIDFGLEALLSFAWQSSVAAFVSTGGGAAVAVDVDMLVFDLYGGPFANVFLGDGARLYGGAGPLMQWCRYEQDTVFTSDDGSGFGLGYYARLGLEFAISGNTMIGFGVRWSDVEVDLSDNLGDLQTQGIQYLFTVTQGF